MIRCIQIGTTTIQGHVIATWVEDRPYGPEARGAILSMGRVMMGRLIPQERGNIKEFDNAPRCYECDCENGGADCSWIAPPPPACQECWGVGYFLVEESGEDVTCRACGGAGNTKDLCNALGGALGEGNRPDRLVNKGAKGGALSDGNRADSNLQKPQIARGGAVEVCPLCDIAGCRHIREAGNG